MDLENRSTRNNLRILGIKNDPRETWEECENKICNLLKGKLEMDTSNTCIERVHRVGEKSDDKERAIVFQFSFYRDKTNILRNFKKVKETKISIFEYFSQKTMQIRKEKWKVVPASRKKGKISYFQYRSVICKERRTLL